MPVLAKDAVCCSVHSVSALISRTHVHTVRIEEVDLGKNFKVVAVISAGR